MKVRDVVKCNGCPMQHLFPDNAFVPHKAGKGLRLVIAEAPGEEESIKLEPLVGGAGRWFDSACKQAGLKRDDLTLVNVINCRPPENVFPTDLDAKSYISHTDGESAVSHCLINHVLPLLESRPWQRIDLLGGKALQYITGKMGGIYKWRGSPILIDTNELRQRLNLPTVPE